MIRRTLAKKLKEAASQFPVVTVTGPRQSGKTTLVRAAFESYDYLSLESPDQRAFALEDPRDFLAQFKRSRHPGRGSARPRPVLVHSDASR